nr:ribonuclease H-like domain-containing protein [Tanacetum cinerariifolium]
NVPSFVQPTKQVKSPRPSVQHVESSIPAATPKPASLNPTSNGKRRNRKACFVGNHKHYAQMTLQTPQRHVVSAAVVTQSKPVPITAARPVSTAVPKIKGKWEWKPKCLTLDHVYRNTSASMTIKMFDYNDALGRSKHMTGNMTYPSDFEKLNGGYVTFEGNPKSGKIFGKCKIKTGKLDFDDVYFVKELKFNLFSVSQMCDKKNSVLFTDTECFVLSHEFKLPDESQVLLRVPKETNMYNVTLKNIAPSGDLTCLFAKATIDKSNLWHRRLAPFHQRQHLHQWSEDL